MTETTQLPAVPKVTVGYERSIQVRDFEPSKASIFVSADIAGTYNDQGLYVPEDGAVADAAAAAFFEAKLAVLKQLHLPYEILDNVVIETIDKVLGPVDTVSDKPAQALRAPRSVQGNTRPKGGGKGSPPAWAQDGAYSADKADLQAELLEHPERYFDNREGKQNPKAPDFKRKFTGEGIWLDKASDALKEKYAA